jgi:hypothetical protein
MSAGLLRLGRVTVLLPVIVLQTRDFKGDICHDVFVIVGVATETPSHASTNARLEISYSQMRILDV